MSQISKDIEAQERLVERMEREAEQLNAQTVAARVVHQYIIEHGDDEDWDVMDLAEELARFPEMRTVYSKYGRAAAQWVDDALGDDDVELVIRRQWHIVEMARQMAFAKLKTLRQIEKTLINEDEWDDTCEEEVEEMME